MRIWLKHIRHHFEEFSKQGVGQLSRALDVEKTYNDGGDFHHDVTYLVRKGVFLCDEGLEGMERALSVEDDDQLLPRRIPPGQ